MTHVSKNYLTGWFTEDELKALEQGLAVWKATPYNGTESGGRVLKILKGGLHYATIEVLQ
jgi:hypothetical protein